MPGDERSPAWVLWHLAWGFHRLTSHWHVADSPLPTEQNGGPAFPPEQTHTKRHRMQPADGVLSKLKWKKKMKF